MFTEGEIIILFMDNLFYDFLSLYLVLHENSFIVAIDLVLFNFGEVKFIFVFYDAI